VSVQVSLWESLIPKWRKVNPIVLDHGTPEKTGDCRGTGWSLVGKQVLVFQEPRCERLRTYPLFAMVTTTMKTIYVENCRKRSR
jgi:hypothetical protein